MAGREHAHAALIGGDRVMPSPIPFDGSSGGDGQSWSATGVASHIEQGVDVGTRDRAVGIAPGATRASQASCVVEPLSPGRYRVQFTADAELKRQIDLARDLLRHAVPRGDLATLVSRALELLIEATLRRRFGSRSRKGRGATGESVTSRGSRGPGADEAGSTDEELPLAGEEHGRSRNAIVVPAAATEQAAIQPCPEPSAPVGAGSDANAPLPGADASRHFPSAIRRIVLERDGLRCTWQAPDGTRCNSRAWLEHDHITPHGKGGSNDAANGRILCRAHHGLAAEQAYGQDAMARIIDRRRAAVGR